MLSKEEIVQAISDGNMNPKMFEQFFLDMKIRSFSYDYVIQKHLVEYYETDLDLSKGGPKLVEGVFSEKGMDFVVKGTILHKFVVAGEKERYKRSNLYRKYIHASDITKNIRFFLSNPVVFIDGEIVTDYVIRAFKDKIEFYFKFGTLHDIYARHHSASGHDDFASKCRVMFMPNALIAYGNELKPELFSGCNMRTDCFTKDEILTFDKSPSFFGFWINKETGAQFFVNELIYNKEYKYFTLPDPPPVDVRKYKLMVIGTRYVKQIRVIDGNTEWIQYTSEKMPLPKDNFITFIYDGTAFVPNDGTVSYQEYYPNIYHITNPNHYNLRIIALYDSRSQNSHIDYDEELEPYLKRIDLFEQYKTGTVPQDIQEFSPIEWSYSIGDLLKKNPYADIDFTDPEKWTPMLYKLQSISDMLKRWYLLYEEYERRTFGFLSGWYHNVTKITNLEDKLRYNTGTDIDDPDMYTEFDEPQYVFIYLNRTEYGNAHSFCYFIDGKYTIPTRIFVHKGYQYVYLPKDKINEDSVIEVERFDGLNITFPFTIDSMDGYEISLKKWATQPTPANSLFIVNAETGEYLNDEIDVIIHDPILKDVHVNLNWSVFMIDPDTKMTFIPKSEDLVGVPLKLCANNQTIQFTGEETGFDFDIEERLDVINLNRGGHISAVNRSVIPRLRIFTEDGRLIPKRDYMVMHHKNYFESPKFSIPIGPREEQKFIICYTGYDERLIYHREDIDNRGIVSLDGRVNRPLSFIYYDFYLDGYRLTKHDIEVISPYTFVLKDNTKWGTNRCLEIYEKCHTDDKFVKFDYREESEFILDKLLRNEKDFWDVVVESLEACTISDRLRAIDDYRDHWYDFYMYWVPYNFIEPDTRKDLEAYFHVFHPILGRTLLDADDRIRYRKLLLSYMFFDRDVYVEGREPLPEPPERELDIASVIPDLSIQMPEKDYRIAGYWDEKFNPVYDEPFELFPADPDPVTGHGGGIYPNPLVRKAHFPHIDNTDRYVVEGTDDFVVEYAPMTQDLYRMLDIYGGWASSMYLVPDTFDIVLRKMDEMYMGCHNLIHPLNMDMSRVTSAEYMFSGCYNLVMIGDKFDTSKLTSLKGMFRNCQALNESNIPTMDTRQVEIFDEVFYNAKSLTGLPNGFVLGRPKSLVRAFYGCTSLPKAFPAVIDCTNIESLDALEGIFDQSSVRSVSFINMKEELRTQIDYTLLGSSVREIYIDGVRWAVVIDDMYRMSDLYPDIYETMERIPSPIIVDRAGLHTAEEMFKNCFELINIDEFDTSKAKSLVRAMANCRSLPKEFPWTLDLSEVEDIHQLEDMFQGSSVVSIKVSGVSDVLRDTLGIALSDKIRFILYNDKKLYFFADKSEQAEEFPDTDIVIK